MGPGRKKSPPQEKKEEEKESSPQAQGVWGTESPSFTLP